MKNVTRLIQRTQLDSYLPHSKHRLSNENLYSPSLVAQQNN